jgi:hypothetical protein
VSSCPNVMSDDAQKLVRTIRLRKDPGGEKLSPVHSTFDRDLTGVFVIVYDLRPIRRDVHRKGLYSERRPGEQTESSRLQHNDVPAITDREIPDARTGEITP